MKTEIKSKIFETYLSVVLTSATAMLGFIYINLAELNSKMAVIVEKVSKHDTMLIDGTTATENLEKRIRNLEMNTQILLDRGH